MKNSPGNWAPWIWDPDPPPKPMSEAERKQFAERAYLLFQKYKQQAPPQAPES